MKFEDLSSAERQALAAYGYEIAAELEAKEVPDEGNPTEDPRWDPERELKRLRYQKEVLNAQIENVVKVSRDRGSSWNSIGKALGITAEAARKHYSKLVVTASAAKSAGTSIGTSVTTKVAKPA